MQLNFQQSIITPVEVSRNNSKLFVESNIKCTVESIIFYLLLAKVWHDPMVELKGLNKWLLWIRFKYEYSTYHGAGY